jgi:DNA-binding NarL/FixJ family response regulator
MLVHMAQQLASIKPESTSVFIAARHDSLRAALWSLLDAEPGIEPLAATADGADLVRLLRSLAPAVVVVDESVVASAEDGWLPTLVATMPHIAFIVVGMEDDRACLKWARQAGAADYVCVDEAERLGRSVVEASSRVAPFAAGWRPTGRPAISVVPAPGGESIAGPPPT